MNELRGAATLLATNLRRDKILLPVCVATFALAAAGSAAATAGVYPDLSSRVQGAELVNATPALVAMYGRIYDPTSAGEVAMFKLIAMGTAMVGLFAALVVIRHTRADEELGRTELLSGGSVGRFASLAAALIVSVIGVVAIGMFTAIGLAANGLPTGGSIAFGLSWTVGGLALAGVGAAAAQLTASARAARGLAVCALAVAFLLRALGDTARATDPGLATWLSPIGWAQQIRPYAGDRWLLALAPLVFGAATVGLALLLSRRRDLGAGLLPQRPGVAHASPLLNGSLGLAWRQQRAAFLGWLVAFVILSVAVGQILSRVGDMLGSPSARRLVIAMGGMDELTGAFLAVELSFIAVFASAYGISSLLRLAGEESSMRADLALSATVGRVRWAGAHLVLAVLGTGVLMLACGLGLGLMQAAQSGSASSLGDDVMAALVRLPAVWVLIAITMALYGVARRAAPIAWAVLVATFLASEIGPLFDLPGWVRDLSPFTHIPPLPGGEITVGPVLALVAVAAGLMAVGLLALRRRDIAVS